MNKIPELEETILQGINDHHVTRDHKKQWHYALACYLSNLVSKSISKDRRIENLLDKPK